MLPKSSPRVAKVHRLAEEIAREFEQEYVGTEHVLLAIFSENEGRGAQVLKDHKVTGSKLRSTVDKLIQKSMEETWVFGRLPGTPHYKNVMATAIQQCQELGAELVCTEHLLLALLKEKGSVAHKAMKELGLEFEQIRDDIAKMMEEDKEC